MQKKSIMLIVSLMSFIVLLAGPEPERKRSNSLNKKNEQKLERSSSSEQPPALRQKYRKMINSQRTGQTNFNLQPLDQLKNKN